jgi:hypothetical protein
MAIVVLEEMLGGLDEVKEALDQAITVLTDLVEECDPILVPHLPEVLDRTLLQPLTAHRAAVGLPTICQPPSVNFLPHLHAWFTTNPTFQRISW